MVDRLKAGGDLGERDTWIKNENEQFVLEATEYLQGVISEVSARVGMRRRP